MSDREKEFLERRVEQTLAENRKLREDTVRVRETIPPTGGQTVAANLSPQFGTEPKFIAAGSWDIRKLTNIEKKQLLSLAYLLQRGKKVRFYKEFIEEFLNLAPSVGGKRVKEMIQMQQASSGQPPVEPEPQQPGWIGRHITNRNWREESE